MVQSVGRVMGKAPNKELGYVILPVVIPAGVEPEQALNNNEAIPCSVASIKCPTCT